MREISNNITVLLTILYLLISRQHAIELCTHSELARVCRISSDHSTKSLEFISANLTEGENVSINIEIPLLSLTKNVSFNNLHSLTINGHQNSSTVINCTHLDSYSGITFEKVKNITLSDLKLRYCGSLVIMKKRNQKNYRYSSALTLRNCNNVEIRNFLIEKSRGIGLMILNNWKGNISIFRSNFTKNKIPQEFKGRIYGGGGVYVYSGFKWDSSLPISIKFEHCLFYKNVAYTKQYRSFYTDEFGKHQSGNGRGGGAYLAFEKTTKTCSYVLLSFSNCIFKKNQAFLGGGLSVNIGGGRKDQILANITTIVRYSVFDSNGCDKYTRIGGGIHLSYYLDFESGGMVYKLQNVKFISNCAELGGGVFFFSSIWTRNSINHSLIFETCRFESNRAHTGSAIDMNPNSFARYVVGYTPIVPVFKNCSFVNNKVFINSGSNNAQRIAGAGIIYSSLYNVKFEGKNHFEHNIGTAIYVVNGNVDLINSDVTFKNNSGIQGGAMALIGRSSMSVGPNRTYNFMNNEAIYQGGAIYVLMIDNHDFTLSKTCFIQYHNGFRLIQAKSWNNNITFVGNKAPFGPAIFATSLHPCQLIQESNHHLTVNASQVFSIRGIHINKSEVATEGAQLHREHNILYAIPGRQYNHGVTVKDDTNNTIKAPLRAEVRGGKVNLDPVLSSGYVGEKIQLTGTPGERANLSLRTVSTRQGYTVFEIELQECPPGFKLDKDKCVCDANEYFGLTECDYENFLTHLTPGLWAGLIGSNKEMVTSICPRSFCDYEQSHNYHQMMPFRIVLPQKSSDLDKAICGKTRTGILCGSCRPGYTVHFHSPKHLCKPTNTNLCKLGWIFYILTELVPVTVVFITVIFFNISFTSGAVNGFILFSQILLSLNIDASGIIMLSNQRFITEGYQFLYGFLNLDFFTIDTLSFCLWPNTTALDMLAFKYITIVYALSLVILVIWFMNKCGGRCLSNWWRITTVRSSIIHGISAFLIICYSQSVLVSHSLVNGANLWSKESSNTTMAKRVWFDGNMIYLSKSHLPYALPAIFCLLTIGILPPLLLIAYPMLNKVLAFFGIEESRVVTNISQKLPISKLKPLLDCFQGCFKDNLRFFAGLYFLYRWVVPITFTTASSLGIAYVITEIFLILILAIHAFSQPYMNRVHNMVDTILFTDLLLINSITCIHYFLFQTQEIKYTVKKNVVSAKIQATLIYLPFVAMVIYILLLGAKHIYNFWYTKYRREDRLVELNVPAPKTLQGRLRAAVHSTMFSNDDRNEQELPYRLFTDNTTDKHVEDSDSNKETY